MQTTAVSSAGMAYLDLGAGSPIVLVHGVPGSGATWHPVAEALAEEHRVIVPDLLGFRRSARPTRLGELHAEAQGRAMVTTLTEVGVRDAVFVGHDFGGPVALAVAAVRPGLVAGIGLLASNVFPDTPIPFPLSVTTWPVLGRPARAVFFSAPALAAMVAMGGGRGEVRRRPSTYLGDAGQRRTIATIFGGSLRNLAELYEPTERALRSARVPAFVGWGDRDPFFPVEQGVRTANALGAALRVYSGAGHFLPEERPMEIVADVRDLAARVAHTCDGHPG